MRNSCTNISFRVNRKCDSEREIVSLLFNATVMYSGGLEPKHGEDDNGCVHGGGGVRDGDEVDVFDAIIPGLIVRAKRNE